MKKPTKAESLLKDNIRRATNHAFFSTLGECTSWKIVLDSEKARQVELVGNSDKMLAGLLENKPKFDELGVDVLGKKTETGLILHIKYKEETPAAQ